MRSIYPALATRLSGLLSHLGVGPHAFDDTVGLVSPLLRVHRLQARVVERIPETASACTLVLQAGSAFPGVVPGQHMAVTVEMDGVRHRRSYSPRPVDGRRDRVAITVQRQPGGRVSTWLTERTRVGDVLELGLPTGGFVLPEPVPPALLMVAGGSGITPGYAMLQWLREHAPRTQVTLIYFARSRTDRIFAAELERLTDAWRALRYAPIDTLANVGPADRGGRVLDRALLDTCEPRWTSLPAWCCGPAPLMDTARRIWSEAGAVERLHTESFGARAAVGDAARRHHVSLMQPHGLADRFEATQATSLLEAAEAAGHAPKHGCRQGICHECTCRLESGSVVDLTTGQRLDGEGQNIRLCISAAMSDVTLQAAR